MNKNIVKEYLLNTIYDNTYLRPFVFKNNIAKMNCFIVGINPATRITINQILIDDYVELLFDDEKFKQFYLKTRLSENKAAVSKTRKNFEKFIKRISNIININIYETNVITYPTKNEDELNKIPSKIKNESTEVFIKLLQDIKPEIILLHGAKTKKYFFEKIQEKGIGLIDSQDKYIIFDNNKKGLVLESKHFMYYGDKSEHFLNVLNRIEIEIKNKNLGAVVDKHMNYA